MQKILLTAIMCMGLLATAQEITKDDNQELPDVPYDMLDAFQPARETRDVKTRLHGIFALGWNQALGDGNGIGEDYRFWGSGLWELGLEFSTRLVEDDLIRFNYGIAMQWQTLRITGNRQFQTNNDITQLVDLPINVDKSKFSQYSLIAPFHLELGRGELKKYKNGAQRYDYEDKLIVGLGGYIGTNAYTTQLLKFENEGRDITNRLSNDFEMESFVYGLSAYAGLGDIQIFAKYGLNSIFKDSPVDQHHVSIGFRWR